MTSRREFLAAAGALVAPGPATVRAVVDPAGGGDFPTIQRAVDHVLDKPPASVARVVLEIRPGVYRERVKVPPVMPRLTLLGKDPETTVISYSMSAKEAGGTFFSSIVEVGGAEFEAYNIGFENTFGVGSQAVALAINSDRAVFRNCRFLGWQDTLYAQSGRQVYRDCRIEGHVDFIFGNAAAVFDRCTIHSRGAGYITAHSRTTPDGPTGYVFRECKLTGDPEQPVYLGRPWRACGRVVYLDCWMDRHIRPEGWDNWRNPENEKTAWFGEYNSTGPGANPAARVKWTHQLTKEEAAAFEAAAFLAGWRP